MTKKLKTSWDPIAIYLPPNTIEQSIEQVMREDKVFGDGTLTYEKAKELVIKFRKSKEEESIKYDNT